MKINSIKTLIAIVFAQIFFEIAVLAQTKSHTVNPPTVIDFAPILNFLAHDGLEGRETGTRGANISANYIASMMMNAGLKPFKPSSAVNTQLSDYFQTFKLIRIKADNPSIGISLTKGKKPQLHLNLYNDFNVNHILQSITADLATVFAGYGIVAPELGYNDYAGLDVNGKIVLIMEGYPGQHDSLSIAREKFRHFVENDDFDLDRRCQEAAKQGAKAVITVSKSFLLAQQSNQIQKNVDQIKNADYEDAEYILPSQVGRKLASCFRLNRNGSEKLASMLEVDFKIMEQQIAQQMKFQPVVLKNRLTINAATIIDTLTVSNVIGILPGRDTAQTIVLGAHYDHLGIRGNIVFSGADDNASGVAGLLALAKVWAESQKVPPCNILFASWTAEEKGFIGSEYFVSELRLPEKVKLYINMDMISRSEKVDTSGRMLSIGIRLPDEYLRELAQTTNALIHLPFVLDLWDVTGYSGSDYASFTAKNIPIMTYNTGLHDDYHTPRDIPERADLVKMGDVLKLVNTILQEILNNMPEN